MTWDIVTHRNSPIRLDTWSLAVSEKVARFLVFHLRLTLHIAKELDRRSSMPFASSAEQSDGHDAKQAKSNQEILNHYRRK